MSVRARPNTQFFCGAPQVLYKGDPEEVRNKIQALGYDLSARYAPFLNRKNLSALREGDFEFQPSTFGKRYLLFISHIGEKNYSLFLNRKTNEIINGRLTFATTLFHNTLLEGELIKTTQGKWIFLIGDLLVEENHNLMDLAWDERKRHLQELLQKKYRHDEKSSHCLLRMKHSLPLSAMRDYTEKVLLNLTYRCSGLVFKNKTNYTGSFMYVFPEARTDMPLTEPPPPTKTLPKVAPPVAPAPAPAVEEPSVKEPPVVVSEEDEDFLAGLEKLCVVESTEIEAPAPNPVHANTCVFLVEKKPGPDVYQLFCRGNEKHSFACVPSTQESQVLKKVLEGGVVQRPMRCIFNPRFKKWIPQAVVEEAIDTPQTVQEMQAMILRTWVDDEEDI